MPEPQIGDVRPSPKGNMVLVGADWRNPQSWQPASVADVSRAKARGTQVGKSDGMQVADRRNQFDAAQGMQEQANTAYQALSKTDTGPLAGVALGWARLTGNRDKAQQLGALERMGGEGALTLADSMKGALSDKDVAFLKSMTYDIGKSGVENVDVARTQEWASQKARSYLQSRSRWERELGSIEARDATGNNFDDAWAQYSANTYPRPQLGTSGRYKPAIPRKTDAAAPAAQIPRKASAAPAAGTKLRYNPATGDFE